MDQQVKMSSKVPIFNGEDYAFWSIRMRSYLLFIRLNVWMTLVSGYVNPKSPPTDPEEIKEFENNAKASNAILDGLAKPVVAK